MTVIAAVLHEGHVYMGADSLMSDGYGGVFTLAQSKVWRADNGMLVGCTGSVRHAQVMRHALKPGPLHERQDITEYLCTTFVNDLRRAHAEAGTLHQEHGQEYMGVSAIIGWRGRLFMLGEHFSVTETADGFAADGSGGTVALAVLHATPDLPPEERLNRAMQAAERYCVGVRGPFRVLSDRPD